MNVFIAGVKLAWRLELTLMRTQEQEMRSAKDVTGTGAITDENNP